MDTSKWVVREHRALVADEKLGIHVGDSVFNVFDGSKWLAKGSSPAGAIDRAIKAIKREEARKAREDEDTWADVGESGAWMSNYDSE